MTPMTWSIWSGPDAAAGAGAARDRVAARDVRVRAVVEVEQRALGALEDDVPARGERVLDERRRVDDVPARGGSPQASGLGDERLEVEARESVRLVEDGVPLGQHAREPGAQDARVEQVAHADAGAPRPVGVGGADAATRGAQLRAREAGLGGPVEGDVVRHDHVRRAADADARGVDAALGEHRHLVDERARVDDDAGADDRRDVRVEHAAGHEVELEDLVADDDGVAGVVAALVAHDHVDRPDSRSVALPLPSSPHWRPDDHGGRHQSLPSAVACRRPRRRRLSLGRSPPLPPDRGEDHSWSARTT